VAWTGNLTGTSSPTNININSNLTVEAVFAENQTAKGTPGW